MSVLSTTLLLVGGIAGVAAGFEQLPAPIWPADGNIPDTERNQYVFLSPDMHNIIVAFPPSADPTAPRKILTITIHNRIDANVAVTMKHTGRSFTYQYSLLSTAESRDNVNVFSVVVSPDPEIQVAKNKWGGMIAQADIAKRVGLRYAPMGRFIGWMSPDAEPLRPGSKADFFVITSSNRPGFTTAYVGQFPAFESSEEWGEEIIDQLDRIADVAWVEQHIITFGPRYSESDSPQRIAVDYLAGIADLTRAQRINANSPFVQELSSKLRKIATGPPYDLTVHAEPASPLEEQLRQAVTLCFGSKLP